MPESKNGKILWLFETTLIRIRNNILENIIQVVLTLPNIIYSSSEIAISFVTIIWKHRSTLWYLRADPRREMAYRRKWNSNFKLLKSSYLQIMSQ